MKSPEPAPFTGKLRHDTLLFAGGVFVVGVFLPAMISLWRGFDARALGLAVSCSFLNTLLLWAGCRFIITRLWYWIPWQKHPWLHLLTEVFLIVTYSFVISVMLWSTGSYLIPPEDLHWYAFLPNFAASAGISLLISFIHEGIYFFHQWKNSLIKSELLEKEQLISRYETLKNQVNPHFLFNSLNTLISLIEEDREIAVEYVQKVSGFYRALIQVSDRQLITLEEEMELIRMYFFIQQYRYGENLILETRLDAESLRMSVAPLALQMLAENAVKHNVIATGKPLTLVVESTPQNYVVVRNNLQKRLSEHPGTGIGLQNIRNRYALLTDRQPEIIESPGFFTVALPLLKV